MVIEIMFIYKTTNLINGKIYIGQCKRKKEPEKYIGSGNYLKKAIKKYGRENFSREILEDGISNSEILNEREKYWIKLYDSTNPSVGYNISPGGNAGLSSEKAGKTYEEMYGGEKAKEIKKKVSLGRSGIPASQATIDSTRRRMTGATFSESTRKKQSDARRGKKLSPETRRKMSESRTGEKRPAQSVFMKENNPMSGKEHTPETRKKISEKNRGVKRGPMSDESKKKISDANKGKPKSEETRRKLSVIAKNRTGEKGPSYNKKMPGASSKYKGVFYEKKSNNWRGQIQIGEITHYIGMFRSEIEAAMGINELLWECLGWMAKDRVNNISKEEIEDNWNIIPPEKKIPRRSKK